LQLLSEIPTRISRQRRTLNEILADQSKALQRSKEALASAAESAKRAIDQQVVDIGAQLDKYNMERESEIVQYDEKMASDLDDTENMIRRIRSFVDTLG